jgi:hypothetical protein
MFGLILYVSFYFLNSVQFMLEALMSRIVFVHLRLVAKPLEKWAHCDNVGIACFPQPSATSHI